MNRISLPDWSQRAARILVIGTACVALVYQIRFAVADYRFQSGQQADVLAAIDLAPGNVDYLDRLADFDGVDRRAIHMRQLSFNLAWRAH